MTTGASNDIERATEIARNMVTKWGLSDKLGPLTYSEDQGEVFLGRSVTQHKQVSDVTAHAIDEEVRRLIDSNYQRAKDILESNLDKLHKMAEALIKYETIDETQIKDIMEGRDPKPPAGWDDTRDAARRRQEPRSREARSADRQAGEPALSGQPIGQQSTDAGLCRHRACCRSYRRAEASVHACFAAARTLDLSTPVVMGILNVTPDSFSDGGRFATSTRRVAHALRDDRGGRRHHRRRRRVDAAGRAAGRRRGGDPPRRAGHRSARGAHRQCRSPSTPASRRSCAPPCAPARA